MNKLIHRSFALLSSLVLGAGCGTVAPEQPLEEQPPAEQPPEEQPPEEVACTPGELLGCSDATTATICDTSGTGVITEACSTGCNVDTKSCNECAPNTLSCEDGTTLQACGADGNVASTETCAAGCTAEGQCKHIEPAWLPTACDARASAPTFTSGTAIDTDDDSKCNGGIVKPATGPEICVLRYGTITLGSVRVTGTRAIAFVADHALDVSGRVDVSADGAVSGPGGGFTVSGTAPSGTTGGGGAGFQRVGANGGGDEFGNNAGVGGAAFNPLTKKVFEGGARATSASPGFHNYAPEGGGGGGALMLVSCEGTVDINGFIDAGGGGGEPGGDGITNYTGTAYYGGAGGGAGGYVVVQGMQVVVSGRVYANGGGGGGGCATDNCKASAGNDGYANNPQGSMGGSGTASIGGNGGHGATLPTRGENSQSSSPGGGGGSTGRLQIYTPEGVAPVLTTTATVQPAFEPKQNVTVR